MKDYRVVADWFAANNLVNGRDELFLNYREDSDPFTEAILYRPNSGGGIANGTGQNLNVSVVVISKVEPGEEYDNYLQQIECASIDGFDALPDYTIRCGFRGQPVQTLDKRTVTEFNFVVM